MPPKGGKQRHSNDWPDTVARLEAKSEENGKFRIQTFYSRMPDGTIKFSQYHTALTDDAISFHAIGFIPATKARRRGK
jgi:hypothetical protein